MNAWSIIRDSLIRYRDADFTAATNEQIHAMTDARAADLEARLDALPITDAQVGATARMLYVQLSGRKWTDAPDHAQRLVQESYCIIARAALEAARAAGGAP